MSYDANGNFKYNTLDHEAKLRALHETPMTPDAAGRPERVWIWQSTSGAFVVYPYDPINSDFVPYVPESEVTRLRAEVEGAYREGYVDANGSDGNDPCAVDRDWENSLTRALLAARKGEG